ncbi:non-hydrolyzing UDP-N-acetylglucosamine 2-epimerase [Candidatus Nitrosotenuis uzonensis]|uniref:UDP-N-acetylglucosamine 2-epimerase homolog n=1 Tax=Candidatus Nitrosotenuis uzonensis TaxID=1407055 RepID=A0A812F034_9ARCH|nr:UDP-N-acetylglucosamine 2-epimerase (non-hydrolyzing) [Candidatus Nitrosotenuis uzonensis]CAE6488172.1 UDP-N-acetylglucosamine 2-epimerase homolog [Candidatus Nitrosotenuis uzonensis]
MTVNYVSIIVGTRPQIIKIPILVQELRKRKLKLSIIHTGQHYDYEMSRRFFRELDIPKPTINLNVGADTPIAQISKIIMKLEHIFLKNKPDLVLVPGDTTSAIGAALATSKCDISLAHLEAGARSNQFHMAEEINRRMIDHCSNLLFAPTKNCFNNLKNENVFGSSYFVGDTMYDLFVRQYKQYNLKSVKSSENEVLLTIHRRENIEKFVNLKKICSIINKLSEYGLKIIFPIHPHTQKNLEKFRLKINADFIEPLGYTSTLRMIVRSKFVITDSGGLQKESYWAGKPCITLRNSTEWIETVKEGANLLLPINKENKIKNIIRMSEKVILPKPALFGSGKAAERISYIIKHFQDTRS